MSFVTPLFLLFGLLAIPIILFYMLRLRRKDVQVSSTMLWQRVVRDREANAPWQRLRRNILLVLQLLILGALVFALARPFLPTPTIVSGSIVILLDGSASMLATDVDPNRFEVAKNEVEELIDDLGGNDQATLILVGKTPSVLVSASGDRTQLRQALDEVQALPIVANWPAALALASGTVQGFRDARIVIVSDGGLPDRLTPLPAETIFIPVGSRGENLALAALATQSIDTGPQLFVSVSNYGDVNQEALVSISIDGTLYDSRRVLVAADERSNLTWNLPDDVAHIEAQLTDSGEDNLLVDNKAWTVHAGGISNRALLITEGNRFIETVFSVLPEFEAFLTFPDVELSDDEAELYDLVVIDSAPLPDPLPSAPLLIIDPLTVEVEEGADKETLFDVTGVFTDTAIVQITDTPLLQFVDWASVNVRQAKSLEAPWAQSLVTAEGGPLLLVGEQNGHRVAILPFRLQDSDLPLQIAFPVLMANIASWLSPGQGFDAPVDFLPGDPIIIRPEADTDAVTVRKPDGIVWTARIEEGSIVFAETEQLGLYHVSRRSQTGESRAGSFAVNLFAPGESKIKPVTTLKIGQVFLNEAGQENAGQRDLWPWLVAIAFVILLLEWWVYHRGTLRLKLPTGRNLLRQLSRWRE